MTAYTLNKPFDTTRTLRVNVIQRYRSNLVCDRMWINGHIQHGYNFPYQVLSTANRATLEALMATCRGRYLGDIALVDPWDGVTYTCRLDMDELAISGWPVYSSAVKLLEIASFKALKTKVNAFPSTVPFQLPINRYRRFLTVIGTTPSDVEKRYEDFNDANGLWRWGVGGDALNDDQADDLLDCWESNGGPYGAFTFTDPITTNEYNAHFVESELSHTLVEKLGDATGYLHSIRATVEELRDDDSD